MTLRHKLAINPLPWVIDGLRFDLSVERLTVALSQLSAIGYDALHADIPDGMTPAAYRDFLAGFGFHPAPGYFSGSFEDLNSRAAVVEAARVHAASQAALGLTEMFIAQNPVPERLARPAVGAGASADRIGIIADALAAAAEASAAEGVTAALHPHVATWVEVEEEVRGVLDATSGSALALGADVGHLRWAGMDPVRILEDYRDRLVAVHLKDVDGSAAARARAEGVDYMVATNQLHVWTEPGRGSVDFDAVFEALGEVFDGWSVVEVDVPALPNAEESARASFDFLTSHPFFAGGGRR
jgi:inosose dehydratase